MKPTMTELDALLNGTGLILDQPSRGAPLLSVVIALLGKIIPIASPSQVRPYCAFNNGISYSPG